MSAPSTSTAPAELRIEVTSRGHFRLLRGTRAIVLCGRAELERVGHQCLDLAIVLADEQWQQGGGQSDDRR